MFGIIMDMSVLLGSAAGGEGGFLQFYDHYLNIPGFEAWKFLNLAIFVSLLVYLARKPLTAQFKAKREVIRAELIKAEEEKQAALARLTDIEARLAQLESEKESVMDRAKEEASIEKDRLAEATKAEIARLRQQCDSELARVAAQSRQELRRFSAEESVRLAEEKLRAQIDNATDARLVKAGIQEIGGLN